MEGQFVAALLVEHPEWLDAYRAISNARVKDRYARLKAEGDPDGSIARQKEYSRSNYLLHREAKIEYQRRWRENLSGEAKEAYLEKHRKRNRDRLAMKRALAKGAETGSDVYST